MNDHTNSQDAGEKEGLNNDNSTAHVKELMALIQEYAEQLGLSIIDTYEIVNVVQANISLAIHLRNRAMAKELMSDQTNH